MKASRFGHGGEKPVVTGDIGWRLNGPEFFERSNLFAQPDNVVFISEYVVIDKEYDILFESFQFLVDKIDITDAVTMPGNIGEIAEFTTVGAPPAPDAGYGNGGKNSEIPG